jgi:hypothetical protein
LSLARPPPLLSFCTFCDYREFCRPVFLAHGFTTTRRCCCQPLRTVSEHLDDLPEPLGIRFRGDLPNIRDRGPFVRTSALLMCRPGGLTETDPVSVK